MDFFHGVQVAIMMTVMTNVVQFAYWTVKKKRKGRSHCGMFGPCYLLMLASLLIWVQPVCMLVIGSWNTDNFFFDGGDTGNACKIATDCSARGCISDVFTCDPAVGTCSQLDCTAAHALPAHANATCACAMDSNALVPNTTVGLCIQIFGTYLGFLLLFIGVFQATELHLKICGKWKEMRGGVEEDDCAT